MRIAYVVGWEGGPDTGPFKKIVEQTRTWRALGAEVGLFVLTRAEHVPAWRSASSTRVVDRGANPIQLTVRKERLVSDVLRWGPDVVYHRWSLPYPGLLRLARRRPLVLEINTDDVAEYDLLSPLKGRLNRLTRGHVLRRASGLVLVTGELSTSPAFAPFPAARLVLGNGIDLPTTPAAPAPDNPRPRLLFLGQPGCPWHGLDKLLELARLRPQWDFDVVGPDPAELSGAPANVTTHGSLTTAQYAPLLLAADIGLGTLALHRKHMSEASPLKVREYLAFGLPVIIGYQDTDFPTPPEFLLQLPNDESNVTSHLDRIDAFVGRWTGQRVAREQVLHLDSRAKEINRLGFLESVAGVGCEATVPGR